jgi:hypothetical protein
MFVTRRRPSARLLVPDSHTTGCHLGGQRHSSRLRPASAPECPIKRASSQDVAKLSDRTGALQSLVKSHSDLAIPYSVAPRDNTPAKSWRWRAEVTSQHGSLARHRRQCPTRTRRALPTSATASSRPPRRPTLFAVLNAGILNDSSYRLLKARYYLSWQSLPNQIRSLDQASRTILTLARLTGLLMPVCLLSFLGMSVFEALG